MTTPETLNGIIAYISASFLPDGQTLKPDEDMFAVLDSLQVLRFVVWLEETFQLKVADEDLNGENLGTPARAAEFVRRRSKGIGA
jgi:acyl carrier protein